MGQRTAERVSRRVAQDQRDDGRRQVRSAIDHQIDQPRRFGFGKPLGAPSGSVKGLVSAEVGAAGLKQESKCHPLGLAADLAQDAGRMDVTAGGSRSHDSPTLQDSLGWRATSSNLTVCSQVAKVR